MMKIIIFKNDNNILTDTRIEPEHSLGHYNLDHFITKEANSN